MAAMKIAIIRQRYNPFGGAERFVERALGALVGQGAEVTLITRNWDGAPAEGFRQLTCDPPYSRLFGGRAARDRSFAAGVQQEMSRGGYDITQSHERIPGCMIFRAGDGVHAAWLAHRARILGPLQRLAQSLSPYHRYVLGAERAMFGHPALRAVICNSQMVADEIVHFYGVDRKKLQVIYNGVDTAAFHPGLADQFRASLRHQLGLSEGVPLLLYVGSGFARKGVPQLLRAFARLPDPEVRLLIVGADRQLKTMQKLAGHLHIAGRVQFVGGVRDVRPYYGAADGFVLPTLYDPCPNAALEAMACGLPCVLGVNCGAREWVVEGENGWVVDPLDESALSHAMTLLAGAAGDARRRRQAREAVAGYTLEAMSVRLLALYGGLKTGGDDV